MESVNSHYNYHGCSHTYPYPKPQRRVARGNNPESNPGGKDEKQFDDTHVLISARSGVDQTYFEIMRQPWPLRPIIFAAKFRAGSEVPGQGLRVVVMKSLTACLAWVDAFSL